MFATLTNQPDTNAEDFKWARKRVNVWIAPNQHILRQIESEGLNASYQPFYVDERLFYPRLPEYDSIQSEFRKSKRIDLNERFVIGSFQRDTEGRDLRTPKWQKDPEGLVQTLSPLDSDSYVLLIAGPRRHYLARRCREEGIPHIFAAKPPVDGVDDLHTNTLSQFELARLYNEIDLYLVTSKSEGGPKSIIESPMSGTPVVSTEVGMAPDLLPPEDICESGEPMASRISELMASKSRLESTGGRQRSTVLEQCGFDATIERWRQIYGKFLP